MLIVFLSRLEFEPMSEHIKENEISDTTIKFATVFFSKPCKNFSKWI